MKVLDESCYFPCGFLECRGIAGVGPLLLPGKPRDDQDLCLGWVDARVSRLSAKIRILVGLDRRQVPHGRQPSTWLSAAVSLVNGIAFVPSLLISQMFWVRFVLAALLPSKARLEVKVS